MEIKWGDPDVVKLIEMVSFRRGVGNLLAEGVRRAAEAIGGDAWRYRDAREGARGIGAGRKGAEVRRRDPRDGGKGR